MTSDSPARVTPSRDEPMLFDAGPAWQREWWGMPEFVMGDARPQQSITVNFRTWDDVIEFGRRLGLIVRPTTDSLWFPADNAGRPNDWVYADES